MMEPPEREILRSALYQHSQYEYPLPEEGWKVVLTVSPASNPPYWGRWTLQIWQGSNEVFERSRAIKFSSREAAIDWLYRNPEEPWTEVGQKFYPSGPIPRPNYRRAHPAE